MVISQIYIESVNSYLLCTEKYHKSNDKQDMVILIPGFSESKSDIDYFMNRLGNRIADNFYKVIMVDLFGHGDSYGSMRDVSWEIIYQNIVDIYNYYHDNYPQQEINLICRGFYGNIILNKNERMILKKLVCINPVLNIKDVICETKKQFIEFEELLKHKENEYLFAAMGCEISNIRPLIINKEILNQIKNYNIKFDRTMDDVLFTYEKKDELNYSMEYQANNCFIRDNDWQENLMSNLINKMKGKYENTISNKQ